MDDVERIRRELLEAVAAADSRDALEQVRVTALGRKGRVTELMKGLGGLAADARKSAGATLNRLKDDIAAAIDAATGRLAKPSSARDSPASGWTSPCRSRPSARAASIRSARRSTS